MYSFDGLKPHFYTVNWGLQGYTLIFLFLLNDIDCGYSLNWPQYHNLCFEQKYEKYQNFHLKVFIFWWWNIQYIWKGLFYVWDGKSPSEIVWRMAGWLGIILFTLDSLHIFYVIPCYSYDFLLFESTGILLLKEPALVEDCWVYRSHLFSIDIWCLFHWNLGSLVFKSFQKWELLLTHFRLNKLPLHYGKCHKISNTWFHTILA